MLTSGGGDTTDGLAALFNALDNLKDINNLARELLEELEQEGTCRGYNRANYMY